jgi:hypothetical protein
LFRAKNLNVKLCFGFFEGRTGRRGRMEGRRAYEKKGDPRFLFSPIRPILSLLPVLPSKKTKTTLKTNKTVENIKKKKLFGSFFSCFLRTER